MSTVGIAPRVLEDGIAIASSATLALVILTSFVPVLNAKDSSNGQLLDGTLSSKRIVDQGSRAMVGKPCTSANGKTGVTTLVCHRKIPSNPNSTCLQWTLECH
jgi:hypothetical protein